MSASSSEQEYRHSHDSSDCPERSRESDCFSRRMPMGLAAFAAGYASGTLCLGEEHPAVFPAFSSQPSEAVVQRSGTFTLAEPGTYQITATVNIPAQENIDAALHLTANGEIIPATITRVVSASHTGTYVLSAIVISDGSVTAALTASQDLSLTGAGSSDVLAAITFLRLA